MKKGLFWVTLAATLFLAGSAIAVTVPSSKYYRRVVLNKFSRKAGMAPVVFDHWLHRAEFTCRLCHVDLGFAMQAGDSGIDAETNAMGYYCGACHDGKRVYADRQIFAACAKEVR